MIIAKVVIIMYMHGYRHVYVQLCRRNHIWNKRTCLGINVSGHKRVWAQTCIIYSVDGGFVSV